MRILVTGGAGFIGSHLVDALVADKPARHKVTVVDDLSFGHKKNVNKKAKFIKASITRPRIDKIVKDGKFDVVYNLAAQISVRKSFDDPLNDAEQNIMGKIRLLEACRKHGVGTVVFTSSGGTIYGKAKKIPSTEKEPMNPQNPYTVSKTAGEYYMNYYAKQYGMNCVRLRLGNVYGPRQDPAGEAGVVAIFSTNILAGKSLNIYGDGKQTRDYIYIDDVVSACLKVLKKVKSDISGAYNVGTGIETSVLEIADALLGAAGDDAEGIKVLHAAAVPGELRRSAINSKKFQKHFKWKPKYGLNKGIKQTFEWFKKQDKSS